MLVIPRFDHVGSYVGRRPRIILILPFHVAQIEDAESLRQEIGGLAAVRQEGLFSAYNDHLSVPNDVASVPCTGLPRCKSRFVPVEGGEGENIDCVEVEGGLQLGLGRWAGIIALRFSAVDEYLLWGKG